MSGNAMFGVGRSLMLLGLLVVGFGLLYALKTEAQTPERNPLPLELILATAGFLSFRIGRWLAAKGQEKIDS